MRSILVQHYSSDSVWRSPSAFLGGFRRDLVSSRELAWQLFLRNLKSRYRQSLTGYVWAFVPPLAWAALFVILRSRSTDGSPAGYVPHVLVGLVFWQLFIESAQTPMRSFSEARSMLAKIKFPREALVLSGLLDVLFQLLIRLPMLIAGWMLFPGATMHTWWALPGLLAGLLAAGTCVGILLLPLSMLYQDVAPAVALASGFVLMVTPIGYAPPQGGIAAILDAWNPVSVLVCTARSGWLGEPTTQWPAFAGLSICGLALGLIAWLAARVAFPHLIARLGS